MDRSVVLMFPEIGCVNVQTTIDNISVYERHIHFFHYFCPFCSCLVIRFLM